MPEIRSMARGGMVTAAALLAMALAAPSGVAEQRHGTLAVTVEVVDACHAATGPAGLAAQGCDSGAVPVAVIREPLPVVAPGGAAPLMRVTGPDGYVTVIY